ncbi:LysR family transcriptional regulator [Hydrogenophaga sp. NFH-34]|uniref:LysR family transcriptional regulator n=1 Tax=Hydrogenophaga sp. NFH-34 TaxID=2744446 RepID=UPI001F485430|nr:LysR family transcriptional regulator [Hydrogenophaga sp. NFH-34]
MKDYLRELRVFTVVAEMGHFTRAAERLNLSQSVLSSAISRLEAMLGTRLFDRHTRQCRLTPAGLALLPDAHRLVNDWERLVAGARDFQGMGRGQLTVAAPSAQCAFLLPPLVREFSERHPGVKLSLRDVPEQQVHELVRNGSADLGIATETAVRSDLSATPFYADQYVAAVPATHPLATRRAVEWRHVAAFPVIGPLPENPVRQHLDARLAAAGIRLDYAHEVSLPWTMVGLAQAGLGVAVVTVALRPLTQWRQLVTRPVGRPAISRTLLLLRQPDRALSPQAAVFRDLVMGRKPAATG